MLCICKSQVPDTLWLRLANVLTLRFTTFLSTFRLPITIIHLVHSFHHCQHVYTNRHHLSLVIIYSVQKTQIAVDFCAETAPTFTPTKLNIRFVLIEKCFFGLLTFCLRAAQGKAVDLTYS